MKILYISLSASPGMQRYSINICNEAAKIGQIHLLCTKNYTLTEVDERINILNIVSTKTPRLEINTFNFFELFSVLRTIKKINPDVIHFLSDHPWNVPISFLMGNKQKTVHSIHDPVPHPNEGVAFFKRINNYLLIKIMKLRIIIHGSSYLDFLIKEYKVNRDKLHVIPLGTEGKSNINISVPNENIVLFFGRIKPYKGLENFIKSMEHLLEENKNVKPVIAGEGNLNSYLGLMKSPDRYEIHNRIINEDEIEDFFLKAKVIVLPYNSATQSGIISIAYYYGKPVVVTNVGSMAEVVEDQITGFVVEKDPILIAEKIEQIIDNNELYIKMGTNAKQKLNNELSLDAMVKNMKSVYNQIPQKKQLA